VIAPIGVDDEGVTHNVNGDEAAGGVAGALHAEKLILLTDVEGVLDAKGALMPQLTIPEARKHIAEGTIRGGMIPKIDVLHQRARVRRRPHPHHRRADPARDPARDLHRHRRRDAAEPLVVPKDFLSLADWSADELRGMLARAAELKALSKRGQRPQTLEGRSLAMFFEKPSLRTHVTFEAGMTQLGGHAIWLRPEQVGIGTRETAADVAHNLSRWVDGLVARTYSHHLVEELAAAASIPVINGLTDLLHPCQVMADLQTIAEKRPLEESVIAYVGDGNNMANSLLNGAAVLGLELRLATPESHRPSRRVRKRAEEIAASRWRADLVERGSSRGRTRRALRLHRCVDQHGPGGRAPAAARAVPALPGEREAHGARARRLGAALPARASRRGDHGRGPRRRERSIVFDQAEEPAPRPAGRFPGAHDCSGRA
jgi:hypothetical protein